MEFGGNYNNRTEATCGCTDTGASVRRLHHGRVAES